MDKVIHVVDPMSIVVVGQRTLVPCLSVPSCRTESILQCLKHELVIYLENLVSYSEPLLSLCLVLSVCVCSCLSSLQSYSW